MATRVIITEHDFIDNKEYDDHEVEIEIKGPRAKTVKGHMVQQILNKILQNDKEKRAEIYRLETPNIWFLRATENEANILHGKKYYDIDSGQTYRIQRRDHKDRTCVVQWIPPRLKIETIRKIITNQLGTEATINRREDKSKVDVTFPAGLKEQVPHYIQTTFLDRNGTGEDRLWFVTMKGREQECCFCGDTRHWPTSCPQRATKPTKLKPITERKKKNTTETIEKKQNEEMEEGIIPSLKIITPPPSPYEITEKHEEKQRKEEETGEEEIEEHKEREEEENQDEDEEKNLPRTPTLPKYSPKKPEESWRQWARKENLKVQPTRDKTKGKIRTLIKNITNREEWIKAWELIKNNTAITRREYQIQTELIEKGIDYPNNKELQRQRENYMEILQIQARELLTHRKKLETSQTNEPQRKEEETYSQKKTTNNPTPRTRGKKKRKTRRQ
ncbi:hypothetical protein RRG08_064573 [Elysia crispata]|uniref:Uncharacterized protein n=1 Tax=Elysia crispata TaxID=231223 RepID=A0AAE1B9P4_9GAST|nr:hypothetical protein RRG08_064573 [Elysia crispata]